VIEKVNIHLYKAEVSSESGRNLIFPTIIMSHELWANY